MIINDYLLGELERIIDSIPFNKDNYDYVELGNYFDDEYRNYYGDFYMRRIPSVNNEYERKWSFTLRFNYNLEMNSFSPIISGNVKLIELCKSIYSKYPYVEIDILISSEYSAIDQFDGQELLDYLLSLENMQVITIYGLENYCDALFLDGRLNHLNRFAIMNYSESSSTCVHLNHKISPGRYVTLRLADSVVLDSMIFFAGSLHSNHDLKIVLDCQSLLQATLRLPFDFGQILMDRLPPILTIYYDGKLMSFPHNLFQTKNSHTIVVKVLNYNSDQQNWKETLSLSIETLPEEQ